MNHSPFFNDEIKSSLTNKVNEWVRIFSISFTETPDFVFTQQQISDFFSASLGAIEEFSEKQKSLVVYLEKSTRDILKEEDTARNVLNFLNLQPTSVAEAKKLLTSEEEVEEDLRILNLKKDKIAAFFMEEKDNALVLDSALFAIALLHRKLQETQIKLKPVDLTKANFFKEQLLPQIFQIEHIFQRLEKVYTSLNQTLVDYHQKFDTASKEDDVRLLLTKLAQPS